MTYGHKPLLFSMIVRTFNQRCKRRGMCVSTQHSLKSQVLHGPQLGEFTRHATLRLVPGISRKTGASNHRNTTYDQVVSDRESSSLHDDQCWYTPTDITDERQTWYAPKSYKAQMIGQNYRNKCAGHDRASDIRRHCMAPSRLRSEHG